MGFKKIIDRSKGAPWGDNGMTSAKWLTIPIDKVRIEQLIATQPGVLLHALSEEYAEPPVGGDPYPHVVHWQGELYLEDGHHRVVRAMLRGEKKVWVRILTPPRRPARMKTADRECGWLGCGDLRCEPFCAGIPRED